MRAMMGGAIAVMLAACGGGDGGSSAPEVTIAWGQPQYVAPASGASVPAVVNLGGPGLPPILAVDLAAAPAGPTFGAPPFWMNAARQVPVVLTAARGTYTVTATANVNGTAYRATTTFVVQ